VRIPFRKVQASRRRPDATPRRWAQWLSARPISVESYFSLTFYRQIIDVMPTIGIIRRQVSVSMAWDFWIDRGGTFTDVLGVDPSARSIPTSSVGKPGSLSRRRGAGHPRPARRRQDSRCRRSASARCGWAPRSRPTRCWSARATAPLLLITRGFRDALRIAYQARPDIFAKEIILPEQLYERVIEVR
jgi:hypothetical protein